MEIMSAQHSAEKTELQNKIVKLEEKIQRLETTTPPAITTPTEEEIIANVAEVTA